ncbi:MAG: hypothetical protein ACI8Q1_000581 [Parvicella sp.]|jgi:hypothetical protein
MKRILATLTVSVFVIGSVQARYLPSKAGAVSGNKPVVNNSLQLKSANCAPAVTRETLEQNNVSALIETGGLMWQDRSNNRSAYEVPVGSDEFYIYSGALWMGGLDVNGQLKLAAQKFGADGRDFWTGPLSTIPGTGNIAIGRLDYGPAEIEPDVCAEYDNFYFITKAEVSEYRAWFDCSQDPSCDVAGNFPGYTVPNSITDWPAHGDVGRFQDYYLAPFYDHPGSVQGVYDPANGDYPWYDLDKEVDCRTSRKVTLFGDFTLWWIFNDKGNIHTESGGDPIGMEIRAQAFAFATNDEINNMTFYNYEMVNRSTQRLTETYFAVYVDADIGYADNDYVGCDVSRGVGYAYNGTANDVGGNNAMGLNPGAIGVDFFEGPYQDNDGVDNPLTTDVAQALAEDGIPYPGLGIGYGDGTPDNERLGMKRFTYYTRPDLSPTWGQDPASGVPIQFYNYMKGLWLDNTVFTYGGNGHAGTVTTNYVFTGDSDPLFWSTGGITASPSNWTEGGESNQPADRRFVQAAGPFTLEPGALNNITVGVVYGKTKDGDPFNSVRQLLKADDKAQLLFDNCFRIIDGPSAPDLTIQELDQELILYITNPFGSNNYQVYDEDYLELDNSIVPLSINTSVTYAIDQVASDSAGYDVYTQSTVVDTTNNDRFYHFQGYQVYQMKSGDIGPDQLENSDQARLVAQCDIKDGVSTLINYEYDESLDAAVPVQKVAGADVGIKHSFKISEDEFALGNTKLINHKKYYYIAIAYGFNEYQKYNPTDSPDGQQTPYLPSRNTANGTSIKSVTGMPHNPAPELGGTIQLAEYGFGPKITRVEGSGNGGTQILDLTDESEADVVANYTPKRVTYENAKGPIGVTVVDPLNVQNGFYTVRFVKDINEELDMATWYIVRENAGEKDTIWSNKTIDLDNDQLIPEWGIAVNIQQYLHEQLGVSSNRDTEVISAELVFADSSKQWLSGIEDTDGSESSNWIASGAVSEDSDAAPTPCEDIEFWNDRANDTEEEFEGILGGTWTAFPYLRAGDCWDMTAASYMNSYINQTSDLSDLSSVDVVFTDDKSKWTRVPVLETQDISSLSWDAGQTTANKLKAKLLPSTDKAGKKAGQSGYNAAEGDFNGAQPVGMAWFPGYAIDLESGERLNMAFGEDSWLGNDNGRDMVFNPTARYSDQGGKIIFGGKHYVYVFGNARKSVNTTSAFNGGTYMPAYDGGTWFHDKMVDNPSSSLYNRIWTSCMWVGIPVLSETSNGLADPNDPFSFIETEARVEIRVTKEYRRHSDNNVFVKDNGLLNLSINEWYPMYEFEMDDISTTLNDENMADSALALINVVPNPYYAYSNYEFNRLDNIVKIVNLPDVCKLNIYNVSGTLVRTFAKDSPITNVEWDLTNNVGIPIASGIYLIHVEVPGVGERVLKWYGVVRPPDLDNF